VDFAYNPYAALKLGSVGLGVAALQYGLDLHADGDFGLRTEDAVVKFQKYNFRDEDDWDGIAGPKTQQEVCWQHLWPIQSQYGLPRGLSRGMILGESGGLLGNYSPEYERQGVKKRDVGCCQLACPVDDEARIRKALSPRYAITRLGNRLRGGDMSPDEPFGHNDFYGRVGATTHRAAWWYACAGWNAPAFAQNGARGIASDYQRQWMREYVEGIPGVRASKIMYSDAYYSVRERTWPN
jgi:hypothetical protein